MCFQRDTRCEGKSPPKCYCYRFSNAARIGESLRSPGHKSIASPPRKCTCRCQEIQQVSRNENSLIFRSKNYRNTNPQHLNRPFKKEKHQHATKKDTYIKDQLTKQFPTSNQPPALKKTSSPNDLQFSAHHLRRESCPRCRPTGSSMTSESSVQEEGKAQRRSVGRKHKYKASMEIKQKKKGNNKRCLLMYIFIVQRSYRKRLCNNKKVFCCQKAMPKDHVEIPKVGRKEIQKGSREG